MSPLDRRGPLLHTPTPSLPNHGRGKQLFHGDRCLKPGSVVEKSRRMVDDEEPIGS